MSSIGLFTDESLGLELSRRSTRERKQTQYFGYSDSDCQAEELVSRTMNIPLSLMPVALAFPGSPPIQIHDGMTIAQVTDRGKERATTTPSLVVKLSLPRSIPNKPFQLPPCREAQAPHITTEKKRKFGLMDSEEGLGKSTPLLTGESTTKRQRLSPAKSTHEDGDPPKPRGQPAVWAEVVHIQ